ncbi:hypothetical protein ZIOFF_001733 [Zingiber officinale]|uniref:WHIM2 domain-containing protein n=1 Tax=Zingiber officinale TaxID=94328 RepID=A0A8J5LV97_ZINOF|nr:hypothetical protein ZIOFF_001733 [Zingiber officinale]
MHHLLHGQAYDFKTEYRAMHGSSCGGRTAELHDKLAGISLCTTGYYLFSHLLIFVLTIMLYLATLQWLRIGSCGSEEVCRHGKVSVMAYLCRCLPNCSSLDLAMAMCCRQHRRREIRTALDKIQERNQMEKYGLSEHTLKGELFSLLSKQGSVGLKISDMARISQIVNLDLPNTNEEVEQLLYSTLSSDITLFEKIAPSAYRLRVDPQIKGKIDSQSDTDDSGSFDDESGKGSTSCNSDGSEEPGHRRVYFESSEGGHWEVIDTQRSLMFHLVNYPSYSALHALLSVLDRRGIHEARLIASLEKRKSSLCQAMNEYMVASVGSRQIDTPPELDANGDGSSPTSDIVAIASEAARQSLKKKGLHVPLWRRHEYMRTKWFSAYQRAAAIEEAGGAENNSRDGIDSPCLISTVSFPRTADESCGKEVMRPASIENLGLSLSAVERLGLLSRAEELGVLSAATDLATPGALLSLSLVLLALGPLYVYLLPEDYLWEVALQVTVALFYVLGGSVALAASNFVLNW